MSNGYHHGDLRRTLLEETAQLIAEVGPGNVSLRELARRAGVSHAAPAHHFGDRRGLMTALATEGLRLLTDELRAATPNGFDEAAVAYVRFAQAKPAHYAVMHRPELIDGEDRELAAARANAAHELATGVASIPVDRRSHVSDEEAAQAAWALVHGVASLAEEGALPRADLEVIVRRVARQLFA